MAIVSEIEIAIVTGIVIVIAIEIVTETPPVDFDPMNASVSARTDGERNVNAAGVLIRRGFISRPIMETITMGQPRTTRVTLTACARALTTRGADRPTTLSVRTSTNTAPEDSFQSSEVLLRTVLRIATVFCGAMKRAIKTGRATSSATGFIVELVSTLA